MLTWRKSVIWKLILAGFVLCVSFKLRSYLDLGSLMELHKCPACFGTSLCEAVNSGFITVGGFNTFSNLLNAIGSKNVLFGLYGDKKVVLKKLGHNWELDKLDDILCGDASSCEASEFVPRVDHIQEKAVKRLMWENQGDATAYSSLHLCPSVTNLDQLLIDVFNSNKDVDPQILYVNIWTLILLNGEPLILQILSEREGWPLPRYYGACGRLVVEEYCGDMLSSFLHTSWYTRAHLSHQLLVAAKDFTDKHQQFRFYLTDISMDNIAVDDSGKVKFIDVEDVIIVDKNAPEEERPATWNSSHTSEKFESDGCLAYSTDDICSHHISDHNYYAICQQLLASDTGLLAGTPWEVLKLYPQLPLMVEECAHPSANTGRYEVAQQLIAILANLTENIKTEL